MDTKHIHCMLEKIAEYGKEMMDAAVGSGNVNLMEAGQIVDMVKDLACAEKDALIAKEMRKAHEEDEAEEKYMMKRLKEENQDEYKRMREEYGEDEGERRFYDNYRHANGRFARKGTGSYRPRSSGRRRGYEEPPYLHMPLDYRMDMEDYTAYPPEYWRDMDRGMGKMYYTDGGSGGNSGGSSGGGQSGNMGGSGMSGGNSGGTRGYSDGYNDGYSEGERNGRKSGGNSRYERAKRGYEEVKETHKGNTPEDKQLTMREAEKVVNVVLDEIDEMLEGASPELKNMVKTKTMSRMQKIQ